MKNARSPLATRTITAALALLAVLGVGLGASPAQADSERHRDPVGDVERAPITKAPGQRGLDVVGLENTYEGKSLTLAMSFDRLLHRGFGIQWFIAAPDQNYYLTYDRNGEDPLLILTDGQGDAVSCGGLEAARKGDTVTVVVPRACIGAPESVQIGSYSDRTSKSLHLRVDDARRTGLSGGETPKYGPTLVHD